LLPSRAAQVKCDAIVYGPSFVLDDLALEPSPDHGAKNELLLSAPAFAVAYDTPVHSPPDLLALHHILLI
jgi:hypothetical protein